MVLRLFDGSDKVGEREGAGSGIKFAKECNFHPKIVPMRKNRAIIGGLLWSEVDPKCL